MALYLFFCFLCSEIFPYLVVVIGLENVLVLTKSVVSTPVDLEVKLRIAQGEDRALVKSVCLFKFTGHQMIILLHNKNKQGLSDTIRFWSIFLAHIDKQKC